MVFAMLLPPFVTACGTDSPAAAPEIRVRHLPPTETDIIEAAIRSHDVSLTDHFLCDNLVDGTSQRTFGRYIADLITYQRRGGENWVDVDIASRDSPIGKLWRATIMFHSGEGDFTHYYGVWFLIRQSDGLVLSSSFACPGTP